MAVQIADPVNQDTPVHALGWHVVTLDPHADISFATARNIFLPGGMIVIQAGSGDGPAGYVHGCTVGQGLVEFVDQVVVLVQAIVSGEARRALSIAFAVYAVGGGEAEETSSC